MEQKIIGIDIGNVLIGGGGADTSFFGDNFLETPMVEGAFAAVSELNKTFDVWLLSKCGQKVQEKTLIWLEDHNFFEITGVKREQVVFCRKRNEKAGIAKSLGFVAFIDDREDIIESMQGVIQQPILFTSWKETKVWEPSQFS